MKKRVKPSAAAPQLTRAESLARAVVDSYEPWFFKGVEGTYSEGQAYLAHLGYISDAFKLAVPKPTHSSARVFLLRASNSYKHEILKKLSDNIQSLLDTDANFHEALKKETAHRVACFNRFKGYADTKVLKHDYLPHAEHSRTLMLTKALVGYVFMPAGTTGRLKKELVPAYMGYPASFNYVFESVVNPDAVVVINDVGYLMPAYGIESPFSVKA